MRGELIFLIVFVVIAMIGIAVIQVHKYRYRIKRYLLNRLNLLVEALQRNPEDPEQHLVEGEARPPSPEEQSKTELRRLHKQIEERKRVARETDISHHLWGLYVYQFRNTGHPSIDRFIQDGEWYDVKILRSDSSDGLNRFEFELKGVHYTFVDDEERQGWSENLKRFSLFLYDDSGRCIIEVPMKLNVDKRGRRYSISSDGPKAFLPGDWIKDFIDVKLKHQRLRNQEIRSQKHQERLSEIEELKRRFGISD